MIKFFTADWCSSCNALKANLSEGDLENVEMVDADKAPDEVVKYGIRSIPTVIVFDEEGEEVERVLGAMSRAKFLELKGE